MSLRTLELGHNNLIGSIPRELGNLPRLRTLNLNGNDLTGSIPGELGALTSLQHLWLSENDLSGQIPPQLGELADLERLSISDNSLSGSIPPELGGLANLVSLSLTASGLSGAIPPELGNLSKLEGLGLAINNLSGEVPPELGGLANLTQLLISTNPLLSGPLPLTLANLSLDRLLYFDTDLCIPRDASFRTWLASIRDHRGNGMDCPPADREALVAVYKETSGAGWTNSANWLTDAAIGDWYGVDTDTAGRVTRLSLRANNLSGPLPAEIANLDNLGRLELDQNSLTGSIPAEFGHLVNLERMWLYNNPISGAIPPELGNLESLEVLLLYNTLLAGPLPLALADLTLQAFVYNGTDLCVPLDDDFRSWLASIPNHVGTGLDCPPSFRLDFDDISELDGWTASSATQVGVYDGLLYLTNAEAERSAYVRNTDIFDAPVTNWTASTSMARDTLSRMAVWVEVNHSKYPIFAFDFGSGLTLGEGDDTTDTNWRFLVYDTDFQETGQASWSYFLGYGYGISDAINDGPNQFTDISFSLISDTLRIEADGTPILSALLPALLREAGATDIMGATLASAPVEEWAGASFDWIELTGEQGSSTRVAAYVPLRSAQLEAALRQWRGVGPAGRIRPRTGRPPSR